MQNRCLLVAFYALLQSCRTDPARYGPFCLSVSSARVLAGASRSRTLRRFAGDRGARQRCSALSQKLARKPSEPPRAPRCAASKLCSILPINFQARNRVPYPPSRQETQLLASSRRRRHKSRAKPPGPSRRPKVNSHDPMEEPGIEPAAKSGLRPRRRPSARASARRGTQPSLRNAAVSRASVHTQPMTTFPQQCRIRNKRLHETPRPHLRNNLHENAGHGQLPHARPADELQNKTDNEETRQAARLRRAFRLAHGR